MSAVSSVGSSSASLYLQQLRQQQVQGQTRQNDHDGDDGGAAGGVQGPGASGAAGATGFQSRFEAAAKSIGVDSSKLPDIEKQIQTAVQNAQQGSGTGDNRSAVRDAVNGVLQANGIDPAQLQSALKAQGPQAGQAAGAHRHHGKHKTGSSTTTPPNSLVSATSAPASVFAGQTTGTLVDVAA